jgi:uncharacterized protein
MSTSGKESARVNGCRANLSELVVQKNLVYVAQCDIGRGLFAAENVSHGWPLLILTGPVISLEQTLAKGDRMGDPLQIAIGQYLDLEPPGVFLNHSCQPNVGIMADCVLVALRAIYKHEELRFDYSTTMSRDGWTLRCLCGSVNCRGVVRDFETLPQNLQRHYLDLGIVQSFIRSQYQS